MLEALRCVRVRSDDVRMCVCVLLSGKWWIVWVSGEKCGLKRTTRNPRLRYFLEHPSMLDRSMYTNTSLLCPPRRWTPVGQQRTSAPRGRGIGHRARAPRFARCAPGATWQDQCLCGCTQRARWWKLVPLSRDHMSSLRWIANLYSTADCAACRGLVETRHRTAPWKESPRS